jgi:exodeoxyribonuclease VII large subunit
VSQPAFDFGADDAVDDEGNPTFTVGELVDAINGTLRSRFFEGVWVRGEIQGWSERGQHAYFSLVEHDDGTRATLPVALFANTRMRLRPLLQRHRLRLGDGMKVRIHGFLDVYAPSGRLSVKMSGIDPRYTLGEMALQRQDLVRTLVAEGLYDRNRSLTLSPAPLRVAAVTSIGSAAWHDFVDELRRSGLGFHVRVVDARVQGAAAVDMVAEGITTVGRLGVDAVVVIRGGGSRTDLAAFDAEPVARAIATCPVPVLTGLGHEIDRSVADEVAHLSLKTPTACAGALVERVLQFRDRTEAAWAAVASLAAQHTASAEQRLGRLGHRIAVHSLTALDRADERLTRHDQRLPRSATRTLGDAARHLEHLDARVRSVDPAVILSRGWSITRTADGTLVTHPDQVAPGALLLTTTAGGTLESEVVDPQVGGAREEP